MNEWSLRVGDLVTLGGALVGMWLFSIKVVRTINGRFSEVATSMARLDERVTHATGDAARAHERIDELASRG